MKNLIAIVLFSLSMCFASPLGESVGTAIESLEDEALNHEIEARAQFIAQQRPAYGSSYSVSNYRQPRYGGMPATYSFGGGMPSSYLSGGYVPSNSYGMPGGFVPSNSYYGDFGNAVPDANYYYSQPRGVRVTKAGNNMGNVLMQLLQDKRGRIALRRVLENDDGTAFKVEEGEK